MSFDWRERPCLVTGGAGFGGSHLSQQLLERGAKVVVLDRRLPRTSFLVLSGIEDRVAFVEGDVRDLDLVSRTLERFAVATVFHLAAQPLVPESNSDSLETLSVNALGTYVMLEAARRSRTARQFVFASSGAYYGTTTTDRPLHEDEAPLTATNIYAPSKVAGDVAVRCYARVHGLAAVACRFMNTYGPGDTHWSRLVPHAIECLVESRDLDMGERDDGSTRLDFLYIADMTRAYLAAAEHLDQVSGEAINFGTGRATRTRTVVEGLARLFDGEDSRPARFGGPHKEVPVVKYLETDKARRLVGWQAQTRLEDGLATTLAWYRRHWDAL